MKVVICGAGISGLALANLLADKGVEVVLLERAPKPRKQGYMIDFFGPGYDAMAAMGTLPALEKIAYRVEEAGLFDERGRQRAAVSFARVARAQNGRMLSVMRPDLEGVLRDRLPSGVELRFGVGPVAVDDDGARVRVSLDDGTELDADLLVGADGIHSTVRRLMFGEEHQFFRYLGFHTAAFTFDAPEIHAVVEGRFCLTDTVGCQMGFYSLRNGRVAAFTVHRTPDPTLPTDVRANLRDVYGNLGWVAPKALDNCPPTPEIYFDQVAQIQLPEWNRGRVVLVGDAAYAVSLLAGQGASLGIAGAFVLADSLAHDRSIPEALRRYERLLRPVVEEKQQVGRYSARWFLPASKGQLLLRRAMLHLARLPVFERKVAFSLTGKSSALVRNLAQAGG